MPPKHFITMTYCLNYYQTDKLTAHLVSRILRNSIAKGIITTEDNNKLQTLKEKLTEEISARLCITPDNITFDELISAIEDQVDISEYI